jgi:hypothetical protein
MTNTQLPQNPQLAFIIYDCKSRTTRIYEYDQSTIDLIKSKQHVFWDDVPDDKEICAVRQVIENKRASNQ